MIHKIKALYDDGRGLEIRAIARELGISRNTVKKYLRTDEAQIHQQQSQRTRAKRMDAHREYIIHLLTTFPRLSAVKVLRKLKEKFPALAVSDRSARRYIRALKETVALKQKRYYEPVLEMVPGVQCQVDGGELRGVAIGGQETVVYFVVFVLSYSRLMYVGLSRTAIDTEAFIRLHDAAFRYFGGRPEECVYDQTKLVVLHEQYRELTLNQRFHAYATAAGFRIHACAGYDPESKGKIEAGVKYVKTNALYGETFADWPALEHHVQCWLADIANVRIHSTTGEAPQARYVRDEQRHMGRYFTPTYLTPAPSAQQTRKVDKTGLLCWQANKYSVPMAWQQARVGVHVEGTQLLIRDLETGHEIARHGLSQGQGAVIKNTDHYRDKQQRIQDLEQDIQQQLGSVAGERLCTLLKRSHPRIYKDQLVGLQGLLKQYPMPAALLEQLGDRATLSTRQIRDYLQAYTQHPERLPNAVSLASARCSVADAATLTPLVRYASIILPREAGDHEQLH